MILEPGWWNGRCMLDRKTKDLITLLIGRRRINEIGCWLYTGGRFTSGYGSLKYRSKSYPVHRLSLELFKGVVFNSGEQANHIIDCPNKHCFNPEHLYKGTQLDNMSDLHGLICKRCGSIRIQGVRCKKCKKLINKNFYSKNKKK